MNPEPERPKGTPWAKLYKHWEDIKLDVHEVYGVDLDRDPGVSWHWFESRLGGLLSMPPRGYTLDGAPIAANRLQLALMKTD